MKFTQQLTLIIFIFFIFAGKTFAGAPAVVSIVLCDNLMENYNEGMVGVRDGLTENQLQKLGAKYVYQLKNAIPVIGHYGYEREITKFGFSLLYFWHRNIHGDEEFLTENETKTIEEKWTMLKDHKKHIGKGRLYRKHIGDWIITHDSKPGIFSFLNRFN
ncbi:MAG: hypothetical protein Q8P68_02110 [Candidatus Peregrinibacteria bacterium]|nr:hypothetical protein [Candidatus Peregrinibacteria bacterium]MDZ4244555.1 hypothetical protein [Candidatus Gracilibacteria bacterium]